MIERVETTVYAHLGRDCPIRIEHYARGPFSHTTVVIGLFGELRLTLPDDRAVRELAESLMVAVAEAESAANETDPLAELLVETSPA